MYGHGYQYPYWYVPCHTREKKWWRVHERIASTTARAAVIKLGSTGTLSSIVREPDEASMERLRMKSRTSTRSTRTSTSTRTRTVHYRVYRTCTRTVYKYGTHCVHFCLTTWRASSGRFVVWPKQWKFPCITVIPYPTTHCGYEYEPYECGYRK